MSALGLWLIAAGPLWAVFGGLRLPRRYRRSKADPRLAGVVGSLWGAALGPFGLIRLFRRTPMLRRGRDVVLPAGILTAELLVFFARAYPHNACVTSGFYVLNQIQTGLTVGMVFATMAVGITLIYSVQRLINFAHGQFVMLGGVVAFVLLRDSQVNPLLAIPVIGVITLVAGLVVAQVLLKPNKKIERADEYGLLMTFGVGIFMSFAIVGFLRSPIGIRAPRYTDRPLFGLDSAVFEVGAVRFRTDLLIAGAVGLLLFVGLIWMLHRTWVGRSFQAVSMDQEAATVVGIDSSRVHLWSYGVGTMLAGMAGAALVPAFNFQIPDMAAQTATRSFVIIVLGGLGSPFGALVGGLFLGVAESLTAGCFPDPSRGATYQVAAGLLIFLIFLLARPQGFFGRKE